MRNHRFYTDQQHLQIGDVVLLSEFDAKHIRKTLRLKTGNKIEVFNGESEFEAELIEVKTDSTKAKVLSEKQKMVIKNKIFLFQSLIKQQNLEFIIEKASELGVSETILFSSDYSQIKVDFAESKLGRLEKIAKSAAKQSERFDVMKINKPINFDQAIEVALKFCKKVYFFSSRNKVIKELEIQKTFFEEENIGIFIGPEGGFSTGEEGIAKEKGFEIVSMENLFYPRRLILRSETAAITAISLLSIILKV